MNPRRNINSHASIKGPTFLVETVENGTAVASVDKQREAMHSFIGAPAANA
jgi:hypothetical protein